MQTKHYTVHSPLVHFFSFPENPCLTPSVRRQKCRSQSETHSKQSSSIFLLHPFPGSACCTGYAATASEPEGSVNVQPVAEELSSQWGTK